MRAYHVNVPSGGGCRKEMCSWVGVQKELEMLDFSL